MFGTFMTVIIIGYIGYYGYNIIHDLYFDKSGDEDRKIAEQKKMQAKATEGKSADENGSAFSQKSAIPNPDEPATMTGGIEADQLPNLVDSLENTEEGSDFFVIKSAFTPAGL